MGLGDLTLLLVGGDSLAQQLHVHLEHRGADIERTEAGEALDTIRVAVPDLIVLSQDAAASDGERIRDALMKAGKPPRVLALCDKKLGAKIATFKHDFVAALEHDIGAEIIASCIESLCTLMGKPSSATRPLRSLVADVRRSHIPSKPISASKQTLAGTAPLAAPVAAASAPKIAAPTPAAVAPKIVAPKPAAVAPADRPTPVVPAPKPVVIAAPKPAAATIVSAPQIIAPEPAAMVPVAPEIVAPKPAAVVVSVAPEIVAPEIVAPKPITSVAPLRLSQPTPLSAMLSMPAAAAKVVISVPAPVAVSKPPVAAPLVIAPVAAPVVIAAEPARPVPIEEPSSFDEELDISISSLPPPAMPVSLTPSLPVASSSPTPTPLFIETQTATPELEPAVLSMKPSPIAKARALAQRLSRSQRYAAAAALLLCLAFATAASVSSDDDEPIAPHATASLAQATQHHAPAPAPAAVPVPVPVRALPLPSPPAPILAAPPPATADAFEEPEDSMVDGELYDPHADPARAKANYLVNMGHRLRKQGRWGMAEASYLKALKVMPNYARAVSGLVAVHLGRRDGVEALRWAKKLVELQPKRGAHQRLLGDAYALTGDKSSARNAWQLGMRLGDRSSRSRL